MSRSLWVWNLLGRISRRLQVTPLLGLSISVYGCVHIHVCMHPSTHAIPFSQVTFTLSSLAVAYHSGLPPWRNPGLRPLQPHGSDLVELEETKHFDLVREVSLAET